MLTILSIRVRTSLCLARTFSKNRGVVYHQPNVVSVEAISYPTFYLKEQNRDLHHGVILKVLLTNICGSDQHMVRGRTTGILFRVN